MRMIIVKIKTHFYEDGLIIKSKYIYSKTTSTSLVKSEGHPHHKSEIYL